jgi:uncharacterized membrane protein
MRTGRRYFGFLLVVIAFVILSPAGRLIAQEDRYELVLRALPDYYYREITPGEESTMYLEIRNAGNRAITDIRLTSDNPKGWDVSVRPDSIDYLGAGSSQAIDVNVTAPSGTERGDYTLTILAEASPTRTATSIAVRVESAFSLWLWIGTGVAVLAIAAFVIIFLRLGRDKPH